MQKNKSRTFQETWYSNFPWITVSTTRTKASCYTCREANKQGLLSVSKYADVKFTTSGFDNWKKSLEKFRKHKASEAHRGSTEIICKKKRAQGVDVMISSQLATLQATLFLFFVFILAVLACLVSSLAVLITVPSPPSLSASTDNSAKAVPASFTLERVTCNSPELGQCHSELIY